MLLVFFRHGAVTLLAIGAAALIFAGLAGAATLSPIEILLGAVLFYLSEYAMHRFAFHAPPLRWALLRKLQHRLHYDHHVEPSRLDLLFLPLWFLAPDLLSTAAARRARAGCAGRRLGDARRHARRFCTTNGCIMSRIFPISREPASAAG